MMMTMCARANICLSMRAFDIHVCVHVNLCVCACLHSRLHGALVSCDHLKYSRQNQDSQPAVIPQDNMQT